MGPRMPRFNRYTSLKLVQISCRYGGIEGSTLDIIAYLYDQDGIARKHDDWY